MRILLRLGAVALLEDDACDMVGQSRKLLLVRETDYGASSGQAESQNFVGPMKKFHLLSEQIQSGSFRPDDSAAALIARQLQMQEAESDVAEDEVQGAVFRPGGVLHLVPEAERRHIAAPDPGVHRQHRASGTLFGRFSGKLLGLGTPGTLSGCSLEALRGSGFGVSLGILWAGMRVMGEE